MTYPIIQIRSNFPILSSIKINNCPLTYLDSAASAQKPISVIKCQTNYYQYEYAAAYRSIHTLSHETSIRIEKIRTQIADFINARSSKEIIFTKGTTECINFIANSWGWHFLQPGDNIIITEMEHHANIVPWQILSKKKQLILRYIPLLPDGTLDISLMFSLINKRTKIVSVTHVSNVLGTINPLKKIIYITRLLSDAIVVIDGAQNIMHQKLDVQNLDCDFYAFSGHKIYGPSGTGILFGKKELLDKMPPWEGGGGMIRSVSLEHDTIFNDVPWRFEAGSLNTAGIIGLSAAINYVEKIGLLNIQRYEFKLIQYTLELLKTIPDIIIYGLNHNCDYRTGVISFNLGTHHAYDVGNFLNQYGIAIRTGHHCAMPLMSYFKVSSMCRVSLAMYSNKDDIHRLINGLLRIKYLLG